MFNLCNFFLYAFVSLMSLVGMYFTITNRAGDIFEVKVIIKVVILFISFIVFIIFAIQYMINYIRNR